MNRDRLNVVLLAKKLNTSINEMLARFPNNEKILRDSIKKTIYDIIELIYEANYISLSQINPRLSIQAKILAKISLLDFFLEESYNKGYLTEDMFNKKTLELSELNIKIKGWIKYGQSNSETNI